MTKRLAVRRLAVLLSLAVAMLAPAAVWAQQVSYFGLDFPETIGGATRSEPHDYEQQRPGLGYSVKYRASGWAIDVYIYDLRQRSIPADPNSGAVRGQLVQATNEVLQRPTAAEVKIKLRYALRDDRARVRFLCTSFELKDRETPVDSYLCVTSSHNKFVKFRLSTQRRDGSDADANAFVRAWIPILWPVRA